MSLKNPVTSGNRSRDLPTTLPQAPRLSTWTVLELNAGLRCEMPATNRPRHGPSALYLYVLLRKVRFNIIPFTANFVTETIFIRIVKGLLPAGEHCREL